MWEIYMLGAAPYPSMEPGKLLPMLLKGYRMPCPSTCPMEPEEVDTDSFF